MKRYRLLKDTLNGVGVNIIKKGTIVTSQDLVDDEGNLQLRVYVAKKQGNFHRSTVENNPGWFELVEDEDAEAPEAPSEEIEELVDYVSKAPNGDYRVSPGFPDVVKKLNEVIRAINLINKDK